MSKQNKTDTRTKKKKKTITLNPLIIIILLVSLILVGIVLYQRKTDQKNINKSENETTTKQEIEQEKQEYSLIDMNNTENAKIEGGTKENTSSKLAEEKKYKGMTVKNIKLVAEGGVTRLTATVENTTKNNYEGGGITIIFTNADGSEYARLEGVLPAIDSGKSNELDAGTTADIANAYDFIIE